MHDTVFLEWAQGRFREEVQSFADDPHGYCGNDFTALVAWERLEHIAKRLDMDAAAVLLSEASAHEVARLTCLTGRDFG